MQIDPNAVKWDDGPPRNEIKWDSPRIVSNDTPDSLQAQFWQAKRDGDEKTAVATFRKMREQGIVLGSPPSGSLAGDAAKKTADSDSMGANAAAAWGEGSRKVVRGLVQGLEMLSPAYHLNPARRYMVDNLLPDNPTQDKPLNQTVLGMTSNIGAQAVPFSIAPEVRTAKGAMSLAGLQGFAAPLPTGENTLGNRVFSGSVAAPLGGLGYLATRGAANSAASLPNGYSAEAQATIDAAKRLEQRTGVPAPLNAGDLGSPNVRQMQDVVFENTPGSGRVREMTRQQGAVTAGVEDLKTRFPPTADHPETVMQQSMLQAQKGAKAEARRLYDDVATESRKQGVPPITPTQSAAALTQALQAYPEILNGIGNSVTRGKLEGLVSGRPISFGDSREILSAAQGELRAAEKQLANGVSGAKDKVLHYGRLVDALQKDQQAWGQQAGGPTFAALQKANAHFREKVLPYRTQNELKSVVRPGANPQGLLGASADGYETAARRMAAMTPEGQDAYRRGLVQKALEKGTRDDGKLNLLTLVNALPNGRAAEQIFSAADLQVINDLSRYAKAVDRSLNVGNTPLTGKQVAKLGPAVLAGGAAQVAGGWPAVAGGVVVANLARRVASSRVLRVLLHSQPTESPLGQLVAQRGVLPVATAAASNYVTPMGLGALAAPRVQDRR